jgi:hypothetical protein
MEKKTARRMVNAFAVATIVFLLGLFVGETIANSKINKIMDTAEEIRLEILDLELQQSLSEYDPCGRTYLYSLGAKLDDIGASLAYLEEERGKQDQSVIDLKKPYTLLQVRHYLLIRNRMEKCDEDYITLLFFYSNKREYVQDSEKQGYVLKYFSDKYGYERVKVYAIDVDLDLGIVDMLKSQYNITEYPSTVVNDQVFSGFTEQEEFQRYF